MRGPGGRSVTSAKANSNTSCLVCGPTSTFCRNRVCDLLVLWTAWVLALLPIRMSLAAWNPGFRTRSEPSIGCIWLRDIRLGSACKIPPPNYSESVSPPLSRFAEIENGHNCAKPTRIAWRFTLVPRFSQGGARSISRPGRNGSADGNCRGAGHDYLRDLSYSLCLRGCDLHTHHFARNPKGHAAISWNNIPLCRGWGSLCFDFGGLRYQRSHLTFSLGDCFIRSDFLCTQCDDKLRRGFNIRPGDRCRHSHMGTACLRRNECRRYALAHFGGIGRSSGYCGNRAGVCSCESRRRYCAAHRGTVVCGRESVGLLRQRLSSR